MISNIIYIVLFTTGIFLGWAIGDWNSRKLEKAFSELKTTSAQVQTEQAKLVTSLKESLEASAAKLKTQQEQAEQGLATFEATHQATLKGKDAQIKALKAKSVEQQASGDVQGAKVSSDAATGLECLDAPVPASLVKGLNGISQ